MGVLWRELGTVLPVGLVRKAGAFAAGPHTAADYSLSALATLTHTVEVSLQTVRNGPTNRPTNRVGIATNPTNR